MSSPEIKIDLTLDAAEAARLLRKLAVALEDGDEKPLNEFGISIQGSSRIKLVIKRRADAIALKVRVKDPRPADAGEEVSTVATALPEKADYKSLKKRMGKSFKNIKKSLLAASPPAAGDLALFLEDSAEMLSYPGCGDEYYVAYADTCKAFGKAVAGGDLEEIQAVFNKIGELKSACHDRYK